DFESKVLAFLEEEACIHLTHDNIYFNVHISLGNQEMMQVAAADDVILYINQGYWRRLDKNDNLFRFVVFHESHHLYRQLKNLHWQPDKALQLARHVREEILVRQFKKTTGKTPLQKDLDAITLQVKLEEKTSAFEKLKKIIQYIVEGQEEFWAYYYAL